MLSRVLLAASAAALVIAAPAVAGPGGHGGGGGGGPHGGGGGDPHGGGGGGPHGGGGGGPHGGGPPAFAAPGGGGHGGGPRGGGPQGFAPRSGGGGRHGGAEMTFSGAGFRGGHGHGGEGSAVGRGAGRARGGYGPAMMASRRGAAGGGHDASGAHNNHYASGRGYGRQQRREFARTQQFHGSRNHEVRMARSERGGRSGGQRFSNSSPGWASRQMRASGVQRQSAFGGPGSGRPAPGMQQAYRGGVMSAGPQQRVTAPQQFGIQHLGRHADALAGANYPNVGGANQAWGGSPYDRFTYANNVQVLPVTQVQRFIGSPIGQAATVVPLAPIPTDLSYLYPATPDYYYEWGDGYLYQVDRSDNLIAALIPLLAGGYLPGQYLPAAYMANPVPADYGLDSFYPDEGDLCSRYYQGVVYEVDCGDGYVEEVAPMYAGGYGVGQLLPASYSYYNVPAQYRSIYYDTPDSGYWYSPGAIYRFDPRTSVITSVAALMAPGFSVGQPLPPGYDVYNIPLDYRATYYDTPSAWYRYNNGYIYQVDPVTQLVTAVVASLLT